MESNLQNKLQQFSPTPPDGAWNKIAATLDEEGTYTERLFQYEVQPPLSIWETIEKNLEAEPDTAKVVPFTKRFGSPLRYAAVACFMAAILVTITLTVKRTEAGGALQDSTTSASTKENPLTVNKQPPAGARPLNPAEREEATTVLKRTITGQNNTSRSTALAERKNTSPATAVYPASKAYVTFSDGDGKLRKVSKRMAGFIQCSDGDEACQQRLQRLRLKMASSVVTTDFTGVLEMLRQLQ